MAKISQYTQTVFTFLKTIPKGEAVTYAEVAKQCHMKNPRNVGWVLRQNTDPDKIPCYKVVRSDGSLASGYKFGGIKEQKKRLVKDGVVFNASGKVERKKSSPGR